jgi:hypothetical protein
MKTKKQKIDWRIVCVGLLCLTALEIVALSNGINGTLLKIVLIAIAGVIGITIPNPFGDKK